jgi:hypothetical protein
VCADFHGRGSFDRAVCAEPLAFAADAVRSMGFGFGFAGVSAVLQDQGVAGNGLESLLVAGTASLGEAVGGHLRGKVGE